MFPSLYLLDNLKNIYSLQFFDTHGVSFVQITFFFFSSHFVKNHTYASMRTYMEKNNNFTIS